MKRWMGVGLGLLLAGAGLVLGAGPRGHHRQAVWPGEQAGMDFGGDEPPLIARLSDKHIVRLKAAAASAVRRLISSDRLADNPALARTVSSLRDWGDEQLAAEILAKASASPELLVRLVGSARVLGGFPGYLQPKPLRFDGNALDRLVDGATLRAKIEAARTDPGVTSDSELVRIVNDYLASNEAK